MTEQWRRCAGEQVTLSAPGLTSLTWSVGNVVVTADRVTLQNAINGTRPAPQFRILAAKANVVLDLSAFSARMTADQAETVATGVLARIPG